MMEIREEQPSDIQEIRDVNVQAFGQPQAAELVDKLRSQCGDLLSLIASIEDTVVGHILFSPVSIQSNEQTVEGMGLGPMAVTTEYQRQGVGAELIRAGVERLKGKRCPFVVVLGHPEYYPRFGFEPASRLGIQSEWKVPDEAFMIRVLDKSRMQGIAGTTQYRPEFSEVM